MFIRGFVEIVVQFSRRGQRFVNANKAIIPLMDIKVGNRTLRHTYETLP
jgi:hypothetical protein